jgi:hypothetical protein
MGELFASRLLWLLLAADRSLVDTKASGERTLRRIKLKASHCSKWKFRSAETVIRRQKIDIVCIVKCRYEIEEQKFRYGIPAHLEQRDQHETKLQQVTAIRLLFLF